MEQIINIEKIRRVLKMDISSYALAKSVNMSRAAIEKYRNGQLDIMNMKLVNALKIQTFYDNKEGKIKMDKIKELKGNLELGMDGSTISIWNNKIELLENLRTNNDPDTNWEEVLEDELKQFDNIEPVIECNNGNGIPVYFTVNSYDDIFDFFK